MKTYKDLFLTKPDGKEHLVAISGDKEMYFATLMNLLERDISLHEEAKSMVLAVILADARYRNSYNRGFLTYLFSRYDFGIREIRDAIWLMRNGKLPPKRKYKQSKESYRQSRESAASRIGPSPVGRRLNRRQRDVLKEIIYAMKPHELERSYAANVEVWREVFKYLHTNPKNLQLDWFQEAVYGASVPEDSYIALVRSLTHKNALEYMSTHRIPLKEYRKRMKITPEILAELVQWLDVKSLVRQRNMLFGEGKALEAKDRENYDAILKQRLDEFKGALYLNYGEVINVLEDDRIDEDLRLALAKQLRRNITRFPIPLSGRVRLIVDNSPSMDKAVILAFHLLLLMSMQITEHDIVLVNRVSSRQDEIEQRYGLELPPKSILDAVRMSKVVGCEGMTNLASSLQDVLVEEESKFDSVIFLTDECENQLMDGRSIRSSYSQSPTVEEHMQHGTFAWALEKYAKEIHQRVLQTVIVNIPSTGAGSYCKKDRESGALTPYMGVTNALINKGLPVQTYVVDSVRNIESFLALLNADTPLFQRDVLKTRDLLQEQGVEEVSKKIRLAKRQLSYARLLVLTNGTCKCGGVFGLTQISAFRMGETIQCEYCDKTFTPSFF